MPKPERGGGVRNDASPPQPHHIFQLIRGFFIKRRRNRYSPPRSFLRVHESYLVESHTAGIGLTSLQALHQKLLNVFTASTNTIS
jgi:hypothetical protein